MVGVAVTIHYVALAMQESVTVLEPDRWVGQRFPLQEQIDIGAQLAEGNWIVVLVRHDCSHCREALPSYERWAQALAAAGDPTQIAIIEIPPYSEKQQFPVCECHFGRLNATRNWFVETPVELSLQDGIVTHVVTNR